ncbi:MAG: DUF3107 domain-containing protein [Acidimicrobiales bacterium]
MDIRIGIVQSSQVIELELGDDTDQEQLRGLVEAALGSDGVLWITDRKGSQIGVPAAKLAFIQLGTSSTAQRIGFGV